MDISLTWSFSACDVFVDPRVAISELSDQITQSFTRRKVDLPGVWLRDTSKKPGSTAYSAGCSEHALKTSFWEVVLWSGRHVGPFWPLIPPSLKEMHLGSDSRRHKCRSTPTKKSQSVNLLGKAQSYNQIWKAWSDLHPSNRIWAPFIFQLP